MANFKENDGIFTSEMSYNNEMVKVEEGTDVNYNLCFYVNGNEYKETMDSREWSDTHNVSTEGLVVRYDFENPNFDGMTESIFVRFDKNMEPVEVDTDAEPLIKNNNEALGIEINETFDNDQKVAVSYDIPIYGQEDKVHIDIHDTNGMFLDDIKINGQQVSIYDSDMIENFKAVVIDDDKAVAFQFTRDNNYEYLTPKPIEYIYDPITGEGIIERGPVSNEEFQEKYAQLETDSVSDDKTSISDEEPFEINNDMDNAMTMDEDIESLIANDNMEFESAEQADSIVEEEQHIETDSKDSSEAKPDSDSNIEKDSNTSADESRQAKLEYEKEMMEHKLSPEQREAYENLMEKMDRFSATPEFFVTQEDRASMIKEFSGFLKDNFSLPELKAGVRQDMVAEKRNFMDQVEFNKDEKVNFSFDKENPNIAYVDVYSKLNEDESIIDRREVYDLQKNRVVEKIYYSPDSRIEKVETLTAAGNPKLSYYYDVMGRINSFEVPVYAKGDVVGSERIYESLIVTTRVQPDDTERVSIAMINPDADRTAALSVNVADFEYDRDRMLVSVNYDEEKIKTVTDAIASNCGMSDEKQQSMRDMVSGITADNLTQKLFSVSNMVGEERQNNQIEQKAEYTSTVNKVVGELTARLRNDPNPDTKPIRNEIISKLKSSSDLVLRTFNIEDTNLSDILKSTSDNIKDGFSDKENSTESIFSAFDAAVERAVEYLDEHKEAIEVSSEDVAKNENEKFETSNHFDTEKTNSIPFERTEKNEDSSQEKKTSTIEEAIEKYLNKIEKESAADDAKKDKDYLKAKDLYEKYTSYKEKVAEDNKTWTGPIGFRDTFVQYNKMQLTIYGREITKLAFSNKEIASAFAEIGFKDDGVNLKDVYLSVSRFLNTNILDTLLTRAFIQVVDSMDNLKDKEIFNKKQDVEKDITVGKAISNVMNNIETMAKKIDETATDKFKEDILNAEDKEHLQELDLEKTSDKTEKDEKNDTELDDKDSEPAEKEASSDDVEKEDTHDDVDSEDEEFKDVEQEEKDPDDMEAEEEDSDSIEREENSSNDTEQDDENPDNVEEEEKDSSDVEQEDKDTDGVEQEEYDSDDVEPDPEKTDDMEREADNQKDIDQGENNPDNVDADFEERDIDKAEPDLDKTEQEELQDAKTELEENPDKEEFDKEDSFSVEQNQEKTEDVESGATPQDEVENDENESERIEQEDSDGASNDISNPEDSSVETDQNEKDPDNNDSLDATDLPEAEPKEDSIPEKDTKEDSLADKEDPGVIEKKENSDEIENEGENGDVSSEAEDIYASAKTAIEEKINDYIENGEPHQHDDDIDPVEFSDILSAFDDANMDFSESFVDVFSSFFNSVFDNGGEGFSGDGIFSLVQNAADTMDTSFLGLCDSISDAVSPELADIFYDELADGISLDSVSNPDDSYDTITFHFGDIDYEIHAEDDYVDTLMKFPDGTVELASDFSGDNLAVEDVIHDIAADTIGNMFADNIDRVAEQLMELSSDNMDSDIDIQTAREMVYESVTDDILQLGDTEISDELAFELAQNVFDMEPDYDPMEYYTNDTELDSFSSFD